MTTANAPETEFTMREFSSQRLSERAMALALIYPEPEKGGRGRKRLGGLNLSSDKERSALAERLSVARAVLRWGRDDLVPAVAREKCETRFAFAAVVASAG